MKHYKVKSLFSLGVHLLVQAGEWEHMISKDFRCGFLVQSVLHNKVVFKALTFKCMIKKKK